MNSDLNKLGFGIGVSINIVENNQNSVSRDFEVKFIQSLLFHTIDVEKCLFIKDKANITDKIYFLFRKGLNLKDRTSSMYAIKKEKKGRVRY